MTAEKWIFWGLTALIVAQSVVIWWWVSTWITKWDIWKTEVEKAGGFVTRDQWYKWCGERQGACPMMVTMNAMAEWKNGIVEKGGGAMTRLEHAGVCERAAEKLAERMDECFKHHREWFAQELKVVQVSISEQIRKSIKEVKL